MLLRPACLFALAYRAAAASEGRPRFGQGPAAQADLLGRPSKVSGCICASVGRESSPASRCLRPTPTSFRSSPNSSRTPAGLPSGTAKLLVTRDEGRVGEGYGRRAPRALSEQEARPRPPKERVLEPRTLPDRYRLQPAHRKVLYNEGAGQRPLVLGRQAASERPQPHRCLLTQSPLGQPTPPTLQAARPINSHIGLASSYHQCLAY